MKWPNKKLGEIAECTDGDWILSKDLTTGRDVRLIQLGDIGEGVFLDKTDKWISRKRCDELNCTILKRGEILLARLGDPLAKACIFPGFDYPCITAVDVTIIRPGSEVEPRFLLQYLNSQFFKEQVNRVASGATRKRISRKNLENLQIPLPPLSEQKKIVGKIEKLFAKIDEAERLRAESLAASAALLPSALHQVFSRTEKENWPTKKLGEVCDILDSLRKPVTKRDRKPGPYPYYGATGVQDYVADYIFDEPLVLVGEDGAKWGSGEETAYRVEGKYWVNNHAHVLRPHRNKILDGWLTHFLNISDLSEYITGLTVKKLNQEKLRSIKIPLPPLSEQKKIVAYLDALSAKIRELQAVQQETAADFSALRQSVLARAYS